MKKHNFILIITVLSLSVLFLSCSDLKNDLPLATSATPQIHGQGWMEVTSAGFHGKAIQAENYDMRPCKQCHGADYKGGSSGESCIQCHTKPGGPEYCATCHGNSLPPAPPTDLLGNTASTARGVGAHQIHLMGTGTYSSQITECSGCHHLPSALDDPRHIDGDNRAEVLISFPMAVMTTGGVTPSPQYDLNTLTCSNTFCHGSWRLRKSGLSTDSVFVDSVMTGISNHAVLWTGGSAERACGSCHANPPTGHKDYNLSCSNCHEDVTTASGKLKHINGKIDLTSGGVRTFR
jgi:predicted CxxxxCH...CXXCH cytochrome family protein